MSRRAVDLRWRAKGWPAWFAVLNLLWLVFISACALEEEEEEEEEEDVSRRRWPTSPTGRPLAPPPRVRPSPVGAVADVLVTSTAAPVARRVP
jgi:hypothetical protein